MGLDLSKNADRWGVSVMSTSVRFTKVELRVLKREFMRLARREPGGGSTITRSSLREALEVAGIHETDGEILDRLFTLFDASGDDKVNFKEFIVGISTILRGSLEDKLNFSFELADLEGDGRVSPEEMRRTLRAMNSTVDLFGTECMSTAEIDTLVDTVFREADTDGDGQLNYAEYMASVARHPLLIGWIKRAAQVDHHVRTVGMGATAAAAHASTTTVPTSATTAASSTSGGDTHRSTGGSAVAVRPPAAGSSTSALASTLPMPVASLSVQASDAERAHPNAGQPAAASRSSVRDQAEEEPSASAADVPLLAHTTPDAVDAGTEEAGTEAASTEQGQRSVTHGDGGGVQPTDEAEDAQGPVTDSDGGVQPADETV